MGLSNLFYRILVGMYIVRWKQTLVLVSFLILGMQQSSQNLVPQAARHLRSGGWASWFLMAAKKQLRLRL